MSVLINQTCPGLLPVAGVATFWLLKFCYPKQIATSKEHFGNVPDLCYFLNYLGECWVAVTCSNSFTV